MLSFDGLLKRGREQKASDIHLVYGELPVFRVNGKLKKEGDTPIDKRFLDVVLDLILDGNQKNYFYIKKELDCSFEDENKLRYRANFHYEKGNIGVSLRLINDDIRSIDELRLPEVTKKLLENQKGLILVTGPCGSGKSTTLAAMIEHINESLEFNIVTIEDPIEYIFKNKKALIRQREIGRDTLSFAGALKSVLRQDPDVIMVGELRDKESIGAALTAAETGHLVLATLHTNSAAETISRITDVFPAEEQNEIRVKLAAVLKGVISQRLVKTIIDDRVGAYEVLVSNTAISNNILSGKINQIDSIIESNRKNGMILMRDYLKELYESKIITEKEYLKNLE